MDLVGYLRVSTDDQVRNGNGLDIQRQQILSWASHHDHSIVVWCADEGITGKLIDRPGLLEVYEALADADGVVAQTDTRFGRSLEVQEAFFGRVWDLERRVFTVDVGEIHEDDPDDPMRTAMRRIRGIMAELESGLIKKRMSDGRKAAAAQGRSPGGPRSYGWRTLNGYVVPDGREQAVLTRIKLMRENGYSLSAIVRALNRDDIPTTRGGPWSVTQLKRQLPPGVHPEDRAAHRGWLDPSRYDRSVSQSLL